ncbi:glycosyl hydrolase [Paenibacillus sp. LjRoot153]|uniref:glycosylhydrolase-like jelly roll fold domain-containing protein n=1 Tax=Paenibacillus sp. LjRoot153 TaxID=3342270 RepID=UPI003ECD4429
MNNTLESLKQQFVEPPEEFSPIPFWFWNDELSQEEIIRQIHDFHSKEVNGFVIHPRMGLSHETPYLSDAYMELVEVAVSEAAKLGMSIILYDEGMYPSGSACGKVVQQNSEFASRGLRMEEHPCGRDGIRISFDLAQGEEMVSVQAVLKLSDDTIAHERTINLDFDQDGVSFKEPEIGNWSVLFFIETYSKGTIRGVHQGQDDGEPDSPLAADLLNPKAVQAFISLTHEKYYAWLSKYFGSTIFAFFTDEPDLLGREHRHGLKPWTHRFIDEFLDCGNHEQNLPVLWFEAGEETRKIRSAYEMTVRNRLARTYYKQLADWCEGHNIGLTGHPAASDDIGLLEYFHIPGQDVVWRYIAPEQDKALTGVHSTMGKCSADSARHRNKRRNLNECFGVCGKESGWALNADNIKWYLDWLFVRGVNLISPHAFYYSIRDERRDERPPDVGPNNIWWPEYSKFSRYMKRMSWLMTDSVNTAEVAVLAHADYLPWQIAKPLYENQIEFNYLEEELLDGLSQLEDGEIRISKQRYKALLIENAEKVQSSSWTKIEAFVNQGGILIEISAEEGKKTKEIGQLSVNNANEIPELLMKLLDSAPLLQPASSSIRISCVKKEGINFYVIVNEGEISFEGMLRTELKGGTELWQPWTGTMERAHAETFAETYQNINFTIERRECLIIAIDPSQAGLGLHSSIQRKLMTEILNISESWRVQDAVVSYELPVLLSWTELEGMEHFSGKMTYEKLFEFTESLAYKGIMLDLGNAHEMVRVWINGIEIGVRMWKPYVFDITQVVRQGWNEIRVEVTNTLANRYDGQSLPSGLIGPVIVKGLLHMN